MSQSAPESATTENADATTAGRPAKKAAATPASKQAAPARPAAKKAATPRPATKKAAPAGPAARKAAPAGPAAKKAAPGTNGTTVAKKTAAARPVKKAPAAKKAASAARKTAGPVGTATNGRINGRANGGQQITRVTQKAIPAPAAKKATAKKTPARKTPAKSTPAKTVPAKKTAARKAPSPPRKAPAKTVPLQPAPAPARTHVTVPTMAPAPGVAALVAPSPVEHVEVRHSWFSRRPLVFTRPDWTVGWTERGRRVTRFQTVFVVVSMLIGLAVAASYGVRLLYADPLPVSAQAPDVTCWDRTLAPASECSLPSGVAGLGWVFQSFDKSDDRCVDVLVEHPDYKRPAMWRCTTTVGGRPVDITYSELTSVASGLAYHKDLFQGAKLSAFPGPDGHIDRYVWRQPEPVDGVWRMAAMYVDFPYAVLVEASTLRDRDRTYDDLVRSRDPKHITTRYE